MKDIPKMIIFFISSILITSYHEINKHDIVVKGHILDAYTRRPIKNAKVTIVCWYDAGWDKTGYESKDLVTNVDGSFNTKFQEGYKIIIASVAVDYKISLYEIENINRPLIENNITLKTNNSSLDEYKTDLRYYIINSMITSRHILYYL